ncbi:GGDEF domain-containing protein [Thiolapillus brandeum]|uniref:diguanylate cyclase n=1 Tax=Thiolapillus brandeum TaxID=1076588 RepID=A0A7U6GGA2_9GAMM|nr:GGDEF domain-containing protein [Thiolapillus brandeum]BAO43084.1 conserved hypothetical protein [Thiolapillus brandeum]
MDHLVQAEKLKLLYHQSFPAIFASLFTGILVCVLLWPVQQHSLLLGWYGVLLLSALARGLLFIRYWYVRPDDASVLSWEKPYFITLLASSLIWGIGAVVIIPAESLLHQVVVFLFLVGMAGGALGVYSAHRAMTLATIGCVLLPMSFWFLMQWQLIPLLLVLGTLLFLVTVFKAGAVLSVAMDRSFRLGHELEAARAAAEYRAHRDALTGLYNRRAFYELGEGMMSNAGEGLMAMIVADLDHFKRINDSWGHPAGDKVLQEVGEIYLGCLRNDDLCARLGGEEFGVLLRVDSLEQACAIAEDLRLCLENQGIDCDGEKLFVTASFGVAAGHEKLEALFRDADSALYRAKMDGRNRVECAHLH